MFIFQRMLQPLLLLRPDEGAGGGGQAAAGGQQQSGQQQGSAGGAAAGQQQQGQQQGEQQQGGSGNGQHEERVPYDRFAQVNDQLRQTQEELRTLREQQTQREREGMPEVARLQAELADAQRAREQAEQRATTAEQSLQTSTREAWIRDAARGARFHDPDDAIARIDASVVRTADGARREVEALAQRAAHLVAPEQQEQQQSGADILQQVLNRGERVGDQQRGEEQDAKVIPAADFNKLTADQLVSLQERDPGLYERSLRAAAAA